MAGGDWAPRFYIRRFPAKYSLDAASARPKTVRYGDGLCAFFVDYN